MVYSTRFYISWLLAAVFMYMAFYGWHGVFLNDIKHISFSKTLFLLLAALVYIAISFVLYWLYESTFLTKYIHYALFKGVVAGVLMGFMLFSLTTVLGISFTKNLTVEYMVADFVWQMTEQAIGGLVIGFGKLFIYEPVYEKAPSSIKS